MIEKLLTVLMNKLSTKPIIKFSYIHNVSVYENLCCRDFINKNNFITFNFNLPNSVTSICTGFMRPVLESYGFTKVDDLLLNTNDIGSYMANYNYYNFDERIFILVGTNFDLIVGVPLGDIR